MATILDMVKESVDFLQLVRSSTGISKFVVAVSGGIDSAVSVKLAVHAYGAKNVYALMLPYGDQSIEDSVAVIASAGIPESNIRVQNIQPMVDSFGVEQEQRKGNIMARVRMIALFDWAKELGALIVGTENRSEYLLGYFTRHGDEGSDIEPIVGYYKFQVRLLAEVLKVPQAILDKAPSAGLWDGQTDEGELGFTYQQADNVFMAYFDHGYTDLADISEMFGIPLKVVEAVMARVKSQDFKHHVPYTQDTLNESW